MEAMPIEKMIVALVTVTVLFLIFNSFIAYLVMLDKRNRERYRKERQRLLEFALEESDRVTREIAAEIHDNMSAYVNLLKMTLRSGEFANVPGGPTPGHKSALALVTELSEMVKDITLSLNNDTIGNQGLIIAIQQDIERIETTRMITCECVVEGKDHHIEPWKSRMAYRIVQEATHNALKHADCNALVFSLAFRNNGFEFELEDNGNGFDMVAAIQKKRMGLANMNKRAERLGATLEVRSKPGCGTKIRLLVPGIKRKEKSGHSG